MSFGLITQKGKQLVSVIEMSRLDWNVRAAACLSLAVHIKSDRAEWREGKSFFMKHVIRKMLSERIPLFCWNGVLVMSLIPDFCCTNVALTVHV